MVTKKKGFSLVELICTMTIAAIVTVAAAPNVMAYVKNSKLQNYRTALDNVVSELQIGLPQNRYWNWQEAHESAEEILRSDSGRDVTRADDTYILSNVSNDSDIQFEVKLDFTAVSGQNSQKNVTISGKCLDFDTVTAYAECTVSLKENAVDAAEYPTIVQETHTYDRSGWFALLEDRVKTYGEWNEAFKTDEFKSNDFGKPFWQDDNAVYLNTTDYPANSVTDITFMMKRYCITGPANGSVEGVWSNDGNVYTHVPVYPIVQVENGIGTGSQYKACGGNFKNVEVLVGSDESDDNNWVKYDDVFNSNHFPKDEGYTDSLSPAGRYIKFYSDYVKSPGGNYTKYEPIVKYRVHLSDEMSAGDQQNSRGWIFVGGMGGGENVQPYADASGVYQGISVKVNIPEYKNQLSDLVENHQQWDSGNERYFDTIGLTPVPGETDAYRDEYGNKILYGKTGDTVTKYPSGIPMSVFYGTADEKIENVNGSYACRRTNKIYIDGINGNEGITIKKDGKGYYFEKWENNIITKIYLPPAPEGFHWSEGWTWIDADNNGAYKKIEYYYFLTPAETGQINSHFDRIVPYRNGKFYLNLEESGYGVGDIVKLQFKNIDVDLLANCAERNGGNSFITMYTKSVYEAGGSSHLTNHVFYNSADVDNIKNGIGQGKVIRDYVNNTVSMYVMLKWDDYPYLAFNYEGAYNGFDPQFDINIDWAVKNTNTSIVKVEEFMPMITVTGDDDYAVLTFDWSMCDYITSSNIGNMALEFSKTLNIEVYDKKYNRLSYNASSNQFSPSLLGITSQKNTVMADKLVHIYCYGIGADDLTYTVINAPEPPPLENVTTATTITTTTTTTITTTTTTEPTTTTTTTPTTTTATADPTTSEPATTETITTTTTTTITTTTTTTATEETPEADKNEAVVLSNIGFDTYDISKYFYYDKNGESRVPKQMQIVVRDKVAGNTGFQFEAYIEGSGYYYWNQYNNSTYNKGFTFQLPQMNYSGEKIENNVITLNLNFESDNNYNALQTFTGTTIKFYNYYQADNWNNIEIIAVKFIY